MLYCTYVMQTLLYTGRKFRTVQYWSEPTAL